VYAAMVAKGRPALLLCRTFDRRASHCLALCFQAVLLTCAKGFHEVEFWCEFIWRPTPGDLVVFGCNVLAEKTQDTGPEKFARLPSGTLVAPTVALPPSRTAVLT
jgi:hypothetical protein